MEVGDICNFFVEGIIPPKNKFALCVHVGDGLFLLINSENRKMYNCVPIPKGKKFPKYDSFVGTSKVYSPSDSVKIEYFDKASKEVLNLILEKVKNSKTLSKVIKDKIIKSLSDSL